MKKTILLLGMLSVGYAYSQQGKVGINTAQPRATLDIHPNDENAREEATTNEGLLIPRLTKKRIAKIAEANLQEGTLVYAKDHAYTGTNSKVANITEKGYYYYNGSVWVRAQGPAGQRGPAGAKGASILTGNGNPATSTGDNGDSYVDLNTGNIWTKASNTWTNTNKSIKGQQGPAGPRGATGPAGTYVNSTSVTVNGNQLHRAALTGDVTAAVNNNTVTINNNAITAAKIADNAVTSAKIANGTIANADIANNAINSAKIQDGTVATADLANNAVTGAKITNKTITKDKLADGVLQNIYTHNGTLSGARNVNMGAHNLSFTGTTANVNIGTTTSQGRFRVQGNGTADNNKVASFTRNDLQGLSIHSDQYGNRLISNTDVGNAKAMLLETKTNDAYDAPTTGELGFIFKIQDKETIRIKGDGKVGIRTGNPKASLDIAETNLLPETTPQGVSFPNFTTSRREKFTSVKKGTMIFNTDKQCLEIYAGNPEQWNCVFSGTSQQQQKVEISPAGFTGAYVAGVPLNNGHKVKFLLKNNSFSAIQGVNFSSAVTVTNANSNVQVQPNQNNNISLAGGASTTLEYTLTGTPEQGDLVARFDHLGLQATQTTKVGLGKASIQDKEHYIVSLTYQGNEIQGKINNTDSKVTVNIPYSNGSGSYNAVSAQATTVAGQDGQSNPLTLSIPAGNFSSTGTLQATIQVGGDQEYLVKKLQPGQKEDIATFNIDMNGTQYKVKLVAIGGIPDKYFSTPMKDGKYYHKFIYLPVNMPDGRTWLSQNLGSEYAELGSPDFNPAFVSSTPWEQDNDDLRWKKLGRWFNINKNSRVIGDEIYPTTAGGPRGSQPNIDPCPDGYRLPTVDELNTLISYPSVHNGLFTKNMPLSGNQYLGLLNQSTDWEDHTYTYQEPKPCPTYNWANPNDHPKQSGGCYETVTVYRSLDIAASIDSNSMTVQNVWDGGATGIPARCIKE